MGMLQKIEARQAVPFNYADADFSAPVRVQGAEKRVYGSALKVCSDKRYKLFTETKDYIKILSGGGFIKWSRGETPFAAGDIFLAEAIGEYELSGACEFIAVRL